MIISMSDEEVPITGFRLKFTMGATIEIKRGDDPFSDWIKPEISSDTTWGGIPTHDELVDCAEYMSDSVVSPFLTKLIELQAERFK
jgi:hypothetical protein